MEKRGQQNNALAHTSNTARWNRERLNVKWSRLDSDAMNKDYTFNNLLQFFNIESLHQAYISLDGSKAVGLDGINKTMYGKNLEANLERLVDQIHSNSFKPQNKFEPLFIRNSFGFRPNKSAHNAVEAIYYSLKDNRRPFIVEIDFANFFNNISHELLLKLLGMRIKDKRLLNLIERFLKVGILDQSGSSAISMVGTPQGSVMSPILANVYLHYVLDSWFIEKYASYYNIIVRYADDAIFLFQKQDTAMKFMEDLVNRIQDFNLSLNMDKTTISNMNKNENKNFAFLGFSFYWGRKYTLTRKILKVKTQKKTLHKKIQKFKIWIKQTRNILKTQKIMKTIKLKLIGHYNYFGFVFNVSKLNHFYESVLKLTFKWLNRRSQKRSFSWKKFYIYNSLPKPPVMTKLKPLGWCPYV